MPRISDQYLDCTIYLYRTVAEAEANVQVGGSGFLVQVRSENMPGLYFTYAVTNKHVVYSDGCPVIRLNTCDGKWDILDIDTDKWVPHPDGHDLAVVNLGLDETRHFFRAIPPEQFITKDMIETMHIGPGDDVFMVGRFINHDGSQKNLPSVRFGAISMMPSEPILQPTGFKQESFAVEMKSIGGYSGSPVLLYFMPLVSRIGHYPKSFDPILLGVDWGHILQELPVRTEVGDPMHGWHVRSNSGMVGVVPAWHLLDLLYREDFVQRRKAREDYERRKRAAPATEFDSAPPRPPKVEPNPHHREDFNRLLNAAMKPQKSSDQT